MTEQLDLGEQQILDEAFRRFVDGRFQRAFAEGAGWGLKNRAALAGEQADRAGGTEKVIALFQEAAKLTPREQWYLAETIANGIGQTLVDDPDPDGAAPPQPAPDALLRLLATAKLLQANSVGCAAKHHGFDIEQHGLPDWLLDTKADIEAAQAVLSSAPVPSGEGSDAVVGTNAGLVMSIVRDNLMTRRGYTPYCGRANTCSYGMPRTTFKQGQFECPCGWRSGFDPKFIAEYEAKWATEVAPADGNTP